MMGDANKSTETRRITELAALWLTERGFRPVESEVSIARKWVADLASAATLTRSEAVKAKLLRRPPSWQRDIPALEWNVLYNEWSKEFEALPSIITAAIEVKVSWSDFARDDKWTRPAATHLLYLAVPLGLVRRVSIPDEIGILGCGKTLRTVRPAKIQTITDAQALSVVYQIAIRRDNFTSYARFREFNRQARDDENERTNRARLRTLIDVCHSVATGTHSPQEALNFYGVKVGRNEQGLIRKLEELSPATAN